MKMKCVIEPKSLNLLDTLVFALAIVVAGVLFAGCGTFGSNPSPPTKVETAIFDLHTNYVIVPVLRTNAYSTTNVVLQTITNVVGVIQNQQVTNVTTTYNVVTVTNVVPSVTMTPSAGTVATVQAAGSVGNIFVPGIGGMVSSGVIALLGLWGYLRGNKLGNTANALGQEIETVRTFIKSLPNGEQMDTAIVNFLKDHQQETGVVQQVMDILAKQVSNADAQVAAKEISTFVGQLK